MMPSWAFVVEHGQRITEHLLHGVETVEIESIFHQFTVAEAHEIRDAVADHLAIGRPLGGLTAERGHLVAIDHDGVGHEAEDAQHGGYLTMD